MPASRKPLLAVLALLLAVGGWYLATLREGHDWGDDFSMYIHHAKNLVEGRPYQETGYLFNPANPIAPPTCPPVFPVLLAGVYAGYGMNLTAMKAAVTLSFLVGLFMIWLVFQRQASPGRALAVAALVGFNPLFWAFKDQILSDFPFLAFAYATLFCMLRVQDPARTRDALVPPPSRFYVEGGIPPTAGWALAAGLVGYLAYGTRSVGAVLFMAMIAADVLASRRVSRVTLMALAPFAGLLVLQNLWIHSDQPLLAQFGNSPARMWSHFSYYGKELRDLWKNGYSGFIMRAVFLTVNGLGIMGYLIRLRRRATVLEVFPLFYLAIILSWPYYQGIRYLFPVIPLYLFYALEGAAVVADFGRLVIRKRAVAALLVVLFGSYAARYTTLDYGPLPEGIARPEAQELFAAVRERTPEDAIFIFAKPRALSLFTGRKASVYHFTEGDEGLLAYMRRIGADYLITSPLYPDPELLPPFLARQPGRFQPVFTNSAFGVYRLVNTGG